MGGFLLALTLLVQALPYSKLVQTAAPIAHFGDKTPADAEGYNNLGNSLREKKRVNEAIAAYQKAIELNPKQAQPHYNLGIVRLEQKRLGDAVACFRKAVELDPKFGEAHGALGQALMKQGMFVEAAAATQKALDLLPKDYPSRILIDAQRRRCEIMQEREEALSRILAGGKDEADGTDLVVLAKMCRQYKERYATATMLFRRGFESKPDGPALAQLNRYDAACAAALAGVGKGEEASKLTEEEKAKLRGQARQWLRDELATVIVAAKSSGSRPVVD